MFVTHQFAVEPERDVVTFSRRDNDLLIEVYPKDELNPEQLEFVIPGELMEQLEVAISLVKAFRLRGRRASEAPQTPTDTH